MGRKNPLADLFKDREWLEPKRVETDSLYKLLFYKGIYRFILKCKYEYKLGPIWVILIL
jgi:hypothetical protein